MNYMDYMDYMDYILVSDSMDCMEYLVLMENQGAWSHRGVGPRPYIGGGDGGGLPTSKHMDYMDDMDYMDYILV